jgi:hypothetical protein
MHITLRSGCQRATPYSLVYGMEAVTPLEMEIPLLRVLIDFELEDDE